MKKLIKLNSISVAYDEEEVLKNINLEVNKNDFIGIIGPNGGGKTTLIKTILGLLDPISGSIDGIDNVTFGYLPQINMSNKKFPITVLEVVLSGLISNKTFFKRFSKEEKNKALEILGELGLDNKKDDIIDNLSGGQKQKAFLARAIISDPDILILDEPNTFVDKKSQGELYNNLEKLNKKMAILLVSHDLGVIPQMVKSIACVNTTLCHHKSNKIDKEILSQYNCPVDLITHGEIPHRVLQIHND
ncbi:MAG: metal ABC transporter ATP-binding protein [Fusobacteriota bacterium]